MDLDKYSNRKNGVLQKSGFYRDPYDETFGRYWDGQKWTTRTIDNPPDYTNIFGGIVKCLGVFIVLIIMLASS